MAVRVILEAVALPKEMTDAVRDVLAGVVLWAEVVGEWIDSICRALTSYLLHLLLGLASVKLSEAQSFMLMRKTIYVRREAYLKKSGGEGRHDQEDFRATAKTLKSEDASSSSEKSLLISNMASLRERVFGGTTSSNGHKSTPITKEMLAHTT